MICNTIIKPSEIHGLGLFADRDIQIGEEIIQADHIDFSKNISDWIRYNKTAKKKSFAYNNGYCMINHSKTPNTKRGENSSIIACAIINKGEEITEDYFALPDNENPFYNNIEESIYHYRFS